MAFIVGAGDSSFFYYYDLLFLVIWCSALGFHVLSATVIPTWDIQSKYYYPLTSDSERL